MAGAITLTARRRRGGNGLRDDQGRLAAALPSAAFAVLGIVIAFPVVVAA